MKETTEQTKLSDSTYTLFGKGGKFQWRRIATQVPLSPIFTNQQQAITYSNRMPMLTEAEWAESEMPSLSTAVSKGVVIEPVFSEDGSQIEERIFFSSPASAAER